MKIKKCYKKCLHIFIVLTFIMNCFTAIPYVTAQAAGIDLYYPATGKSLSYNKAKIVFNYNGIDVSLGKITGILSENGVALGPYYDIFQKAMGISCKYSSSKNTITFTHENNKLILTLNSKEAVLNGKKVTMNAAPVQIKFKSANVTKIFVPTRFVAESMGFFYRWDSEESKVHILNQLPLEYNHRSLSYVGAIGKVVFDQKTLDMSPLPVILINNTAMLPDYVFSDYMGIQYSYDKDTGIILLKKGNLTLKMKENCSTAYLNGKLLDCVVAPAYVKNLKTNCSQIVLPGKFVASALGYSYTWENATRTSHILTTDMTGVDPEYVFVPKLEPLSKTTMTITKEVQDTILNPLSEIVTEITSETTGGETDVTSNQLEHIYHELSNHYEENFEIEFSKPLSNVTSSFNNGMISVKLPNCSSIPQTYSLFGGMVKRIEQNYDSKNQNTVLAFVTDVKKQDYSLTLSEDGCRLYVRIYPNFLTSIQTGENTKGSYIRFHGTHEFDFQINSVENDTELILKQTENLIDDIIMPDNLYTSFCEKFSFEVFADNAQKEICISMRTFPGISVQVTKKSGDIILYFDTTALQGDQDPLRDDGTFFVPDGILIPLPSKVSAKDISVEDRYYDKVIQISLPSSKYLDFYKQNEIVNPYPVVNDIQVTAENKKTIINIRTNRIQGYEIIENKNGFWLKLGNPDEIYSKIIVLDAGHGGNDPGATYATYKEKNINYKILNEYCMEYFEASDIKVYFTRINDTKIDLYDRAAFASLVNADLFLSLHMNWLNNSSAKGTSVYYSDVNKCTTNGGLTNAIYAKTLADSLSAALGTNNRGVYTQDFVVVRETRMPAVLIELGFLSNASDRKMMTTEKTQRIAAKTIYNTVKKLFDQYPTNR